MKMTDDKNPCCSIFNKQKSNDYVKKSDSKNNKRVYINQYRENNNLREESNSSFESNRKHEKIKISDTSMDKTINNLIIAAISAIIITILIVLVFHYFIWKSPIKESSDIKSVKASYSVQILDKIISTDS